MKIRPSHHRVHYDHGPNMTPLVDVTMVILIFLMMTGSFGSVEHYLVSNAAFQGSGASPTPIPANYIPPTNLVVRVDLEPDSVAEAAMLPRDQQAGALRWQAVLARRIFTSYSGLRAELAKLAEDPQFQDKKTVQVVIDPGYRVLHRHLIDVYQAALGAGFEKIAFRKAHY
jgi:biopolymer transport protein ExbD